MDLQCLLTTIIALALAGLNIWKNSIFKQMNKAFSQLAKINEDVLETNERLLMELEMRDKP